MLRTQLYADPHNLFLHDLVLESCRRNALKTAVVDASNGCSLTYAEYGDTVESLARGFIAAGVKPGDVVAIFLANSWEFCTAYHAATLAGAIPTLLNPSYREREVRYQLENSGAALLITDGGCLEGINLSELPNLRRVYTTRQPAAGAEPFSNLLMPVSTTYPAPSQPSNVTLGALPYSSGTTGLPKGVMLSHFNLVANVYQFLGPNATPLSSADKILCCLPLYHIYGLNVILNPSLILGSKLILVPRFNVQQFSKLIADEAITMMPLVPPAMNALCQAAEAGQFPRDHKVTWVKSGAAPLAPELPRRFTALTGILVCQGYGMTEASPVTHVGYLDPALYRPDSIGHPVAQTDCRVLSQSDIDPADKPDDLTEAPSGQPGELVMRGAQFMLGYWKEPQATAAVLRDGWFWSGDIVTRDREGFYRVVDRRKEMIKYKGFPVAPAEVEAVLLEHPAVKECGVVGRPNAEAGEIPVAFVALRDGFVNSKKLDEELCAFVADRLTHYKQPREVRFVDAIPKTASGKILRRELRKQMA
ncbi:MAG TPA: AMP-binding protein [Candidatus Sulfotelmatobacter sp.]|jgi:acyl-CoA synthetase (AMP-forming)/AMP-acid ligase II|nr:AMP-binding protein [Candidatus Sulfotelmatobacter sp.]